MDVKLTKFEKYSDKRGDLVVFLKNSHLQSDLKEFGQIYFVTFNKKGVVRGNHYHMKWREWFGIVEGSVKCVLIDIKSRRKKTLILDATHDKYTRLEIGPGIAHAFISITNTAAIINYADSEWYSNDTHFYKVINK